ncbi:MAG: hypothetical protein AMXMBFR8_02160 [Nevskiales bacterium]
MIDVLQMLFPLLTIAVLCAGCGAITFSSADRRHEHARRRPVRRPLACASCAVLADSFDPKPFTGPP